MYDRGKEHEEEGMKYLALLFMFSWVREVLSLLHKTKGLLVVLTKQKQ